MRKSLRSGTKCAGKSTLLSPLPDIARNWIDVLWPNLPKRNSVFTPIEMDEEMGNEIDRLFYKYVKNRPGCPLYTTVNV
jgi:hypothetical protein